MASTPEGKVKDKIRNVLKIYGAYWFCPVQNGMGAQSVDFIGWINGKPFGIEAKAGNKKATPKQQVTLDIMEAHGATVFLINEVTGLPELAQWCCLQVDNLEE